MALALVTSADAMAADEPVLAAAEPASGPGVDTPQASGDQRVVQLNEEGSALYAAGDFRRAVELFIQAYAVDQDPNLLFNIASCYEGLGDVEAALEKYRAFLVAPNADPEGRPRAERAIERLTQPEASEVPNKQPADAPVPAPVAAAPSPAAAPPSGPPSWAAWVGLGGGAALAAAGTTFYLLGAADHAEVTSASGYADSQAVVPMTREEADDLVRAGDTKKAVGVGALVTGGALLGGYLAWWLIDPPGGDSTPDVAVAVDGSSASFSLAGRF